MKRHNYFKKSFLILIGILIVSTVSSYGAEESITLTTYYPSPYGVYNEMQLWPHDNPIGSCISQKDEGLMYYDNGEHTLKVCMCKNPPTCSIYDWMPVSGYWAASPFNSNNIYNTNSGNVGIGTNDPKLPLHIKATKDGWLMALEGPSDKFTAYGLTSDFITGWGMGMWGKSTAAPTTEDFGVGYYNGASWDIPFVIDKSNGNVGIGTTNPSVRLHIVGPSSGAIRIVDGNQGRGKVLTSDDSGVGTWKDAGAVTGEFSAQAGSPSCATNCIQSISLGSHKFCFLTTNDFRINDNTGSSNHDDEGRCRIYESGSSWTLEAFYNEDNTPTIGFIKCGARCVD